MKIITHKNLKMNKQIRLTESELHYIVNEAVNTILQEEMEEGTWNNLKTGAKTFFGNSSQGESGIKGIKNRLANAKSNYNLQDQQDTMNSAIQQLQSLVQSGAIDPNTTVGQLLGKGSSKFGKLSSRSAKMQKQMYKNGLKKPQ